MTQTGHSWRNSHPASNRPETGSEIFIFLKFGDSAAYPAIVEPNKMPGHKTARMAQEQQSSASGALLGEYNSQCLQGRHLADVGEWRNPVLDGDSSCLSFVPCAS
jgi:hypothetical protein